MKTNIHRIVGDSKILYEITEGLRNRELSQKYLYLGEGAERYYTYDNGFWGKESKDVVNVSDWVNLLNKNIEISNNPITYISIACGNSLKEKELLEKLRGNITYIGVDYSEEMIELSNNNLKNSNFKANLIRADINDLDFKRYIDNLSKTNGKRVFLFLGNTFGNIKPTNIVDNLGSHMIKGDYLCIDVTVKKTETVRDSIDIFNHYVQKTSSNKLWNEYILSSLKYVGFPTEKGKVVIETLEDFYTGIYKIIFSLEMLESLDFELEGKVIISKGEKIKFFELYFYNPEKLISFMDLHGFRFVDKNYKNMRGQFVFEKI